MRSSLTHYRTGNQGDSQTKQCAGTCQHIAQVAWRGMFDYARGTDERKWEGKKTKEIGHRKSGEMESEREQVERRQRQPKRELRGLITLSTVKLCWICLP